MKKLLIFFLSSLPFFGFTQSVTVTVKDSTASVAIWNGQPPFYLVFSDGFQCITPTRALCRTLSPGQYFITLTDSRGIPVREKFEIKNLK